MTTLSVTIIGHNEASHLKRLAGELKNLVDEVIYVDCESQDDSLVFATKCGWKVFSRPNTTNLNLNKQFAIDQATSDWIFYLDPDENLPQELISEIYKTITETKNNAFVLPRKNYYFSCWVKYGGNYPDKQLRLFKRGQARFPGIHVHEKLSVEGQIGLLKHSMNHYSYLSINQFIKKFEFYTNFESQHLFKKGTRPSFLHALQYCIYKPLGRFIRRYFFKFGFLDGWRGFFCAIFDSANYIVCYLKICELNENNKVTDQKMK